MDNPTPTPTPPTPEPSAAALRAFFTYTTTSTVVETIRRGFNDGADLWQLANSGVEDGFTAITLWKFMRRHPEMVIQILNTIDAAVIDDDASADDIFDYIIQIYTQTWSAVDNFQEGIK